MKKLKKDNCAITITFISMILLFLIAPTGNYPLLISLATISVGSVLFCERY